MSRVSLSLISLERVVGYHLKKALLMWKMQKTANSVIVRRFALKGIDVTKRFNSVLLATLKRI